MDLKAITNGIVSVVKVILKIGAQTVPTIAASYSPALGTLLDSVFNSVLQAEAKLGPKTGPDKKELALLGVQVAMPGIQKLFDLGGKPIKNPALFAEGVEQIQEGVVKILNATGELAKEAA